jgi:hypothetical protein
MTEGFPRPDERKITKVLVHCEERPAPHVTDNEKLYIFSNSVVRQSFLRPKVLLHVLI